MSFLFSSIIVTTHMFTYLINTNNLNSAWQKHVSQSLKTWVKCLLYYDIIFKLVKQNCLIYRLELNILTQFSKSCPCYITHPTKHSIVWGVTTPPPLSLLPLSSPLFFHLSIILFHTNSFFWSSQLRKIVKNLLQNKWFTQAVKKGSSSFPFSLFHTSSLMYTHTLYLSC